VWRAHNVACASAQCSVLASLVGGSTAASCVRVVIWLISAGLPQLVAGQRVLQAELPEAAAHAATAAAVASGLAGRRVRLAEGVGLCLKEDENGGCVRVQLDGTTKTVWRTADCVLEVLPVR
jgi:hypothetical protein